jgi:protein SCO1/2
MQVERPVTIRMTITHQPTVRKRSPSRAKIGCFGVHDSGLPDGGGRVGLMGSPVGMLALLLVGWRSGVARILERARSSRLVAGAAMLTIVAALVLAGGLIRSAYARASNSPDPVAGIGAAGHDRLDRPAPTLSLFARDGSTRTLADVRGRPALVTFAFGHCETLCPVVVHQALAARDELDRRGVETSMVVFTLDPWRDTPSRLVTLARQWGLDPARDFIVGGTVEAVEAALDAWGIARTRDERTGDIVHAGVIYLVERDGTIAFSSTGGVEHVVSLGARLLPATSGFPSGSSGSPSG